MIKEINPFEMDILGGLFFWYHVPAGAKLMIKGMDAIIKHLVQGDQGYLLLLLVGL